MRNICLFIFFFFQCFTSKSQEVEPAYLNTALSVENRINDLMSRMTLYEKACQMNQFVGIEHMKKAEKIYRLKT